MLTGSCKKKDDNSTPTPTSQIPVLTTEVISDIAQTTATSGGNVTSQGTSAVTVRGVCWSTSTSFTIVNCLNKTTDGADIGNFTSYITGLNPSTPYYVRAYATNSIGTGYGNLLSFTTLTPPFAIGQNYAGGIIFYIDGTWLHGLIAAASDQSIGTGALWGCDGTSIPGTSTTIGTGQANTTAIINGCGTAGIAARICDDLVLNGFTDWFLPSKDELNQIYLQRNVIGGFGNNYYWSSSEYDATMAWDQNFSSGSQYFGGKSNAAHVRAVRAF